MECQAHASPVPARAELTPLPPTPQKRELGGRVPSAQDVPCLESISWEHWEMAQPRTALRAPAPAASFNTRA